MKVDKRYCSNTSSVTSSISQTKYQQRFRQHPISCAYTLHVHVVILEGDTIPTIHQQYTVYSNIILLQQKQLYTMNLTNC